ncbi:VanW family protein [Actinomarinicola tropica]|uniref:VanW family protein n=1 Tax=Actinomarinicola tropica TaxID=2789776 RepID=UPI001E2FD5CB|nr:VanW family protein [Actinomarinicola tropica]
MLQTIRGRWALVWGAGALLLLYGLLMAASFLDPGFAGEDVERNVTLAGEDISGLDAEDLERAVERIAAERQDLRIVLDTGSGTATTDARSLGLSVDHDATIEQVDEGEGPLLTRPFRWIGSFVGQRDVPLRHQVDESVLRSSLSETELPGVTEASEPSLEGDANGVRAVAGTPGAGVDAADLADALQDAADAADPALDTVRVRAPLTEIAPLVSDEQADAAARDAEAATASPPTVVVGAVERPLDVTALRSWLVLEADDPSEVDWTLDESLAAPALAELYADAGTAGTDASFTVQDGVVQIVGGENPTTCCGDGSVERLDDALHDRAETVDLELIPAESERDREWAEGLGIVEEVASFTTTHTCCQNRVTNIHLIADATRGVVIPPGETFSLNEHVGQRTAEKGYLPAGGITNGVVVDQLGGGISQFTTTLFNAAFFAGLDFGEYQAHSIYFSRYPYGREATLSWPHPDLQIRNTSPYGVLIWPSYTDTEITVTLYSTKHVDVEQTGQTTEPQGVCTRVRTERTRRFLDGRVEVDTVGALYRRREGENCSGESSVPTTEPAAPAAPPPPPPAPPPPEAGG